MTTEEMVKRVLEENFHLTVQKIPECENKTPDFFATYKDEAYLIEVKDKGDNPVEIENREADFSKGELFEISKSLNYKSVLNNIVYSGKKQIDAYVENNQTFRIVWIHCSGMSYEATREQIISGIYGSVTLADFGNKKAFSGLCYYFNESHFFKYKETIDAVIISCKNEEVQMMLNNHSPRFNAIKNSMLAKCFNLGLYNPIEKEKNGEAFLVDSSINRNDIKGVLQYLKEKYKTEKLMVMNMKSFSAHVAIPHKNVTSSSS